MHPEYFSTQPSGLWRYHPHLRVQGMTGKMSARGKLRVEPRAPPPPMPAVCHPAQETSGPGKLLSKVSTIILCQPDHACPRHAPITGTLFQCLKLPSSLPQGLYPSGWNARCPTPILCLVILDEVINYIFKQRAEGEFQNITEEAKKGILLYWNEEVVLFVKKLL